MAGPLRVEPDARAWRWLQASLTDDGTVATVVPPIFEAYARILHPATLETPTGETDAWGGPRYASREITWCDAASLIGNRLGKLQPWTLWLSRFGEVGRDEPGGGRIVDGHTVPQDTLLPGGLPVPAGSRIEDPDAGELPLPLLAALATRLNDEHGDTEVIAAVWEGRELDVDHPGVVFGWSDRRRSRFGRLGERFAARRERRQWQREYEDAVRASIDPQVTSAMRAGSVLGLPRELQGRGHVLLRTQLATFGDPRWVESAGLGWRPRSHPDHFDEPGRTPNAVWPAAPHGAPAWFVAADLDLDFTLVGGNERLIERLLTDTAFETEAIGPSDRLVEHLP